MVDNSEGCHVQPADCKAETNVYAEGCQPTEVYPVANVNMYVHAEGCQPTEVYPVPNVNMYVQAEGFQPTEAYPVVNTETCTGTKSRSDPVTPTKNMCDKLVLVETPEKMALDTPSTKLVMRGRPKGGALKYGKSLIADHLPRGRAGNLRSNRLSRNQHRVQNSLSATSLVPVVHAARKFCQVVDGRFEYGCINIVKKLFSSMDLHSNTIRRCFHKGEEILAEAQRISRLDSDRRSKRQRQGIRGHVKTQRNRRSCLGPLAATRSWCQYMLTLQVPFGKQHLATYFLDQLEAHKQALQTMLLCESDQNIKKDWTAEVTGFINKLRRFERSTGSQLNRAVHELEQMMQLGLAVHPNSTHMERFLMVYVFYSHRPNTCST